MSLQNSIPAIFFAALVGIFLIWSPELIDAHHVSRFAAWSLVLGAGIVLVLRRLPSIDVTWLDVLLFGFWGWSSLSLLWAKNFGEAIFTNQKYFLLACTVLLFRLSFVHWKQYARWLAIMVALSLIVTLSITSIQLTNIYTASGLSGQSVYGVFGHSGHKNLVASFIFICLCLSSALLQRTWSKDKWWYMPLGIWAFVILVLLRSRGVFVAMGIGSLLYAVHYVRHQKRLSQDARRAVIGGFALFAIGILVFLTQTDLGRSYQKYFNPLTYSDSASGTERLFVWYKTWQLIEDKPVLGYGTGNWKLFFPSKNIHGGYRLQEQDLIFTRTHNDFLEVWAELGLPGFLLYLAIFGLALWWLYQRYRRAKVANQGRILLLFIGILGYCVIAFFDFPKERIEHQVYLALLLALAARRAPAIYQTSRSMLVSGFLLLALLVNGPISYYRCIGDVGSKKILANRDKVDQAGAIQKYAEQAYSSWYEFDPMVIPLPWYSGVSNFVKGDFAGAVPLFEAAYTINPYNFNVINNYASALVKVQAYQRAIELYEIALAINPRFEEGMLNKAFAHYQLQEYEEALQLVNQTTRDSERKTVFLERIQAAIDQQK